MPIFRNSHIPILTVGEWQAKGVCFISHWGKNEHFYTVTNLCQNKYVFNWYASATHIKIKAKKVTEGRQP